MLDDIRERTQRSEARTRADVDVRSGQPVCSQASEQRRQNRDVRKVLPRQAVDIEIVRNVVDATGRKVVVQIGHGCVHEQARRGIGRRGTDVGDAQHGQACELFRGVGPLLQLAQHRDIGADGGLVAVGQRRQTLGQLARLVPLPFLCLGTDLDQRLVNIARHKRFKHIFEIPVVKAGAHAFERRFVAQVCKGVIVVVEPPRHDVHGKRHAVGHAAIAFAQAERHLRNRGLEHVARDALARQARGFLLDHLEETVRRTFVRAAHEEQRDRLRLRIHEIGRNVAAEFLVEQTALERRLVAAHERVEQDVAGEHAFEIVRLPDHVAGADASVFRSGVHRHDGIEHADGLLRADGVRRGLRARTRDGQIAFIQEAEHLVCIDRAVQDDERIIQAVVARMRVEEAFVGKRRNGARMSARLERVAGVREERMVHLAHKHAFRVGQRAFHLVEDDAVVAQRLGNARIRGRVRRDGRIGTVIGNRRVMRIRRNRLRCAVELVMPAFLLEDRALLVDARIQHGVHVYVDEVEQILAIGGRHGIHRLIGEGHRVLERLHGRAQQVHERLFDRILLRPAQHRVLEDVEDPGVIRGRRLERDGERLVRIVVFQECEARAACGMAHDDRLSVDFGHVFDHFDREAMNLLARMEFHRGAFQSQVACGL